MGFRTTTTHEYVGVSYTHALSLPFTRAHRYRHTQTHSHNCSSCFWAINQQNIQHCHFLLVRIHSLAGKSYSPCFLVQGVCVHARGIYFTSYGNCRTVDLTGASCAVDFRCLCPLAKSYHITLHYQKIIWHSCVCSHSP